MSSVRQEDSHSSPISISLYGPFVFYMTINRIRLCIGITRNSGHLFLNTIVRKNNFETRVLLAVYKTQNLAVYKPSLFLHSIKREVKNLDPYKRYFFQIWLFIRPHFKFPSHKLLVIRPLFLHFTPEWLLIRPYGDFVSGLITSPLYIKIIFARPV